ncbi:hypothetical protein FB45DRAFT_914744, partial [Roridomyces roridus]
MARHCKLDGFCCLTFARTLDLLEWCCSSALALPAIIATLRLGGYLRGVIARSRADDDDRLGQVLNYGNYHSGEAQNTQHSYSSGCGDAQSMANYTPYYHAYANPGMILQGGNTTSMLSSSVPVAHSKHPQVAQTDPAGMYAELPYHLNNHSLGGCIIHSYIFPTHVNHLQLMATPLTGISPTMISLSRCLVGIPWTSNRDLELPPDLSATLTLPAWIMASPLPEVPPTTISPTRCLVGIPL